MRKLFAAFAFLFLSAVAFGQTVTVTGHTITGQNGTSSSGISILWELVNDGGQQCKVSGTGLLTPMSFSVTQAQLAAGIALIPNSSIVCGTTLGANRWRYTIKSNGTGTRQCSLNITGATNLDSTACLNATSTPVTVTPTDSIYARLDGTNAGFTGPVSFGSGIINNGNEQIKGPSPWIDVFAYGAKCDGSTNDTVAFQNALNAAAVVHGTVLVPTTGTSFCVIAGQLIMDGFIGVSFQGFAGVPGGGTPRPWIRFSGTASPLISAKSTTGVAIQNLYLQYTNVSFTGNLIDISHSALATDTALDIFQNLTLAGSGTAANATCLISLDQGTDTVINNSAFHVAKTGICGAATNASYSNRVRVTNNLFSSSTGDLSIAAISNAAQGWTISGNTFELGTAAGNMKILAGLAGLSNLGMNFNGNWSGDDTATGARTLFDGVGTEGISITGNYFQSNAFTTVFNLPNSADGYQVTGNVFQSTGTIFTLGTGTKVEIGENTFFPAPAVFMTGTPASGKVVDQNHQTNYYGNQFFTSSTAWVARNSADVEQDIFLEPGSASEQFGCIVWTERTHSTNELKLCKNTTHQMVVTDAAGLTRMTIGNAANSNFDMDATGNGTVFANGAAGSGTAGMKICSAGTCPTLPAVNGSLAVQGVVQAPGLYASGTAAALTGTGACATFSTQTGGAWAGRATCTAATAASTLTITPGTTAPNGWVCSVYDQTTRANLFQQTATVAASCTLTATSVTQNDVFVFTAIAF